MQSGVDGLAQALAAFLTDLGPLRSRVTVVTISEFGRRVQEKAARASTTGRPRCSERAWTRTRWPAASSRRAVARPMPSVAPVTHTVSTGPSCPGPVRGSR